MSASVFYRVGVPEGNLYETPPPSRLSSSKQESKEGLFIELPCKHTDAGEGRLVFFFQLTQKLQRIEFMHMLCFFLVPCLKKTVLEKKSLFAPKM